MRFNNLNIREEELPEVTQLFLYWASLKEIPDLIYRMPNLEHLNLEGNRITSVPEKLSSCKQLKKLELGTNAIHSPESLKNLPPNLTKLDLSNNTIGEISSHITHLKNLEELHLNSCGIKRIPPQIKQLKKLKILDLYNNQIKTLPIALGKLNGLRELIVGQNKIREIPDVIGNCTRLSKLSARNNNITRISPEIGQCTELNQLVLANNKLETLPDSLENCFTLQNLELSKNKFEHFPEVVLTLKWLTKLFLNKNQLIQVDFNRKGDRLTFLDLSDNKISTVHKLPPSIEVLHLINNQLTVFPEAVLNCTNLRLLHLDFNHITDVPREFGLVAQSLRVFSMWKNPASTTPENLLQLEALERFSGLVSRKEQLIVLAVQKAGREQLVSSTEKPFLLQLLLNKKPDKHAVSLRSLLLFINGSYPSVTQKIRQYLYTRFGIPISRKRLRKGHRLALLGNTNFEVDQLRGRLEKQGITFTGTDCSEATHVLIGWGRINWRPGLDETVVYLSEKHLSNELWRLEEAHLLSNPDPEIDKSVQDLLLSGDNVNIRLGLELLKGGGLSPRMMNYLIVNWLGPLKDERLRVEILQFIKLNSEDEWKFVLDRYNKLKFFTYFKWIGENQAHAKKIEEVNARKQIHQYFKKNKLDIMFIKKALSRK